MGDYPEVVSVKLGDLKPAYTTLPAAGPTWPSSVPRNVQLELSFSLPMDDTSVKNSTLRITDVTGNDASDHWQTDVTGGNWSLDIQIQQAIDDGLITLFWKDGFKKVQLALIDSGTLAGGLITGTASHTLVAGNEYKLQMVDNKAEGTNGLPLILGGNIDLLNGFQFRVNRAPTLTAISPLTGQAEDTETTISHATLLAAAGANVADVDGDAISFRIEAVSTDTHSLTKGGTAVTAGTTTISSGEQVDWTPVLHANGTLDAFSVKAYDGTAPSATAIQVKVTVAPVNDTPTIVTVAPQTIEEDGMLMIDVSIDDVESSGNHLGLSATSNKAGLLPNNDPTRINLSEASHGEGKTRTLTLRPLPDQNTSIHGTVTITLTVSDTLTATSGTLSSQTTFDLTVTAVNDRPEFVLRTTLMGTDNIDGRVNVGGELKVD